MSHCEKPVVSEINICDDELKLIKNALRSDPQSILNFEPNAPVIAFTFDKSGNINFFRSPTEFDKSPFQLIDQQIKNIVPVNFLTTAGTHSVTVSIHGESTTSSIPLP